MKDVFEMRCVPRGSPEQCVGAGLRVAGTLPPHWFMFLTRGHIVLLNHLPASFLCSHVLVRFLLIKTVSCHLWLNTVFIWPKQCCCSFFSDCCFCLNTSGIHLSGFIHVLQRDNFNRNVLIIYGVAQPPQCSISPCWNDVNHYFTVS